MSHRWSGWPGAWCLDCGCEDPMELALADSAYDPMTGEWEPGAREKYDLPPCKEPGSGRFDPYKKIATPQQPTAAATAQDSQDTTRHEARTTDTEGE